MKLQTFDPYPDLAPFVKGYWELEVPAEMSSEKQRVVPEGTIEMAFILADDVKRYHSDTEYTLQPRAMVIGQVTEPFFVQPTGRVLSFAVSFYPYGFANFVDCPIGELTNKDTPISELFNPVEAAELEQAVRAAKDSSERIAAVENFLLGKLTESRVIDRVVQTTINALFDSKGQQSINRILEDQPTTRRNLERKFARQVGMSPKQLGKVVRLQAALNMLLNQEERNLTKIAYDNEYYDQAHFTRDFKEFTGSNPKDFLKDEQLLLSTLFYSQD